MNIFEDFIDAMNNIRNYLEIILDNIILFNTPMFLVA
jgi:hypothetical protein